jgi:hypothetical protein
MCVVLYGIKVADVPPWRDDQQRQTPGIVSEIRASA